MSQSTTTITIETSPATPAPDLSCLVGFASVASSAESSDYTDGVLAGLTLAGRPDLHHVFLGAVLEASARSAGTTVAELIQLENAGAR